MTTEDLGPNYLLGTIPVLVIAAAAGVSRLILTRPALRPKPHERSSWATDLRVLIKLSLLAALWSTLGLFGLWLGDTQYLGMSQTVERGAHWPHEGAGPILYWLWALAVHFLALCVVAWSGKSAAGGARWMVKSIRSSAPKRAQARNYPSGVVPFPAPRGRGDETLPSGLASAGTGDGT